MFARSRFPVLMTHKAHTMLAQSFRGRRNQSGRVLPGYQSPSRLACIAAGTAARTNGSAHTGAAAAHWLCGHIYRTGAAMLCFGTAGLPPKLAAIRLNALQIEEIFHTLCNGSVHTHERELAEGYLTTAVGNRVGVAGSSYSGKGSASLCKRSLRSTCGSHAVVLSLCRPRWTSCWNSTYRAAGWWESPERLQGRYKEESAEQTEKSPGTRLFMDVEKGFPFLEIRFQKEGRHKDHTVGNTPENVFPAGIMPETGGKPHDEKSKHGRKILPIRIPKHFFPHFPNRTAGLEMESG